MITVRQLEILSAVIEHGSFRRCGQKLNISPVSVSEHIRALEAQLGVALFVRSKGGAVTPTEAGSRAFEAVPELLTHVYDFASFVAGDSTQRGPIRIAMHGFMMRNLAAVVARFNETHDRGLQFVSDDAAPEELHRRVVAGELDAAYFYSLDGMHAFGQVVGREALAIYVGDGHPLASAGIVPVEGLSRTPVVSLSADKPLRKAVDEALRRLGIEDVTHVVETSEYGLILSSLHRNLGFTCMFESIKEEERQASGLTIVRCDQPVPSLQIRRVTRRTVLRFPDVRGALQAAEEAFST